MTVRQFLHLDTHPTGLTCRIARTFRVVDLSRKSQATKLEKRQHVCLFFVFMNKSITIPKALASVDCVQRTFYRLANKCKWELQEKPDSWIIIIQPVADVQYDDLELEFKNTLIDYSLREKIRAETEQVRALLFAHAFSNVAPIQ